MARKKARKTKNTAKKQSYFKRDANKWLYLVIVALVFLLVTLVAIHGSRVAYFEEQYTLVNQELEKRTIERDSFREAYLVALADAQAFGELYETDYRPPVPDELQPENAQPREDVFTLSETDVWSYYHERGLIDDSCIQVTKVVQTPDAIVDIAIITSGEGTLRLLIDAQEVERFEISGNETVTTASVSVRKGTHYLDLVVPEGSLEFTTLRLGDRTLETGISLLDIGEGFGVFDCENTMQGDTLSTSGALRVRFEKL